MKSETDVDILVHQSCRWNYCDWILHSQETTDVLTVSILRLMTHVRGSQLCVRILFETQSMGQFQFNISDAANVNGMKREEERERETG